MLKLATIAIALAITAPAHADNCPKITGDMDPCWAQQLIQSEKAPEKADEWTPESFSRLFGQTIVTLTDAGQSVHHYCNPTL